MTTLILTRGYPASMKSTFAREWVTDDPEGRVRLNRDDIRQMLYAKGHGLTWAQEKIVSDTQQSAARAHLKAGRNVIIDDTNLRLRFARNWADLAVEVGVDFKVFDFEAPAHECIARDAQRDNPVGDDVIRSFANRYPQPWPEVRPSERKADTPPEPYIPDVTKPEAWIVDLDGTLAHHDGKRSPYDLDKVDGDSVDLTVADLVHRLHTSGVEIVVVSGREDHCREATETWLERYLIPYHALFMRASDDKRADYRVKADLFDAHIRDHWNVQGVLDDRDQVVSMWRSIGLKCLQAAEGKF